MTPIGPIGAGALLRVTALLIADSIELQSDDLPLSRSVRSGEAGPMHTPSTSSRGVSQGQAPRTDDVISAGERSGTETAMTTLGFGKRSKSCSQSAPTRKLRLTCGSFHNPRSTASPLLYIQRS